MAWVAILSLTYHIAFMATPMHAAMVTGHTFSHPTPLAHASMWDDVSCGATSDTSASVGTPDGHRSDCRLSVVPTGGSVFDARFPPVTTLWTIAPLGRPLTSHVPAGSRTMWPPGTHQALALFGVRLN